MGSGERKFFWHWELTIKEVFAGFYFMPRSSAERVRCAVSGFGDVARQPFGDDGLTCQIALSDKSRFLDVQLIREATPEMATTGDFRSGVIVYDGERIVGSTIIDGRLTVSGYAMGVVPEYRGRNLGQRMLVEWLDQTRRPKTLTRQGITPAVAAGLIEVHKIVVGRALATGKPVPNRVRESMVSGIEEAELMERAQVEVSAREEKAGESTRSMLGKLVPRKEKK